MEQKNRIRVTNCPRPRNTDDFDALRQRIVNLPITNGGGMAGLLVLCNSYSDQQRIWAQVMKFNRVLKKSTYRYITKTRKGSYNVIVYKSLKEAQV